MRKEIDSKHLLGLKDTQCFWVRNTECKKEVFIYKKTPQGTFKVSEYWQLKHCVKQLTQAHLFMVKNKLNKLN